MLPDARLHHHPFPYLTAATSFPAEVLADLRARFEGPLDWQRHDSFYRCHMAHLDGLDPAWLAHLAARMRTLLGVPLTDRVTATVQRMDPGDHALPHTDRPLVGYEVARLIVQLDPGWTPEDGGVFEALGSPDPDDVAHQVPPLHGSAVGFVMTPRSWHAVRPTRRPRHTVVFHFQHVANTPDVARAIHRTFEAVDLASLPAALDAPMAEAEASLPEEITRRAALTAWLLHRWGEPVADVLRAYSDALHDPLPPFDAPAAQLLAAWAVRLRTDDFPTEAWGEVAARLGGSVGGDDTLRSVLFP